MMQRLLLFLFATLLVFTSCSKEYSTTEKYVTLSYKQTFCSDPWQTGATDELTLKNAADYLNAEGLYIAGLTIKNDATPEACNGCNCKTGKTIYVSTLKSKSIQERYLQIGFKP